MIARRTLIAGGLALGLAPVPSPIRPDSRAFAQSPQPVPRPVPRQPVPPPPGPPGSGPITKLPLPRFVSLRASEVNVRRGPGLNYPRDWVFQRAGLPVRVIAEHGDWRRIRDSDGAGGWVYHALISGRRTVLVTAPEVLLRRAPIETARATAELRRGVVARLRSCADGWCRIGVEGVEGWAPARAIWGVGPTDFSAD